MKILFLLMYFGFSVLLVPAAVGCWSVLSFQRASVHCPFDLPSCTPPMLEFEVPWVYLSYKGIAESLSVPLKNCSFQSGPALQRMPHHLGIQVVSISRSPQGRSLLHNLSQEASFSLPFHC